MVMFGSGGVGKKSIINRFLVNDFSGKYIYSDEDETYTKQTEVDGQIFTFNILKPCSASDCFTAMRDLHIKMNDIFFVVHSITSAKGLNDTIDYIDQIKRVKDDDHPHVMIVSNKNDQESLRMVSNDAGRKMAAQNGVAYMEVSAKTGDGVEEMFCEVIRYAKDHSYVCGRSYNIKRAK
eukprot:CAMPEP_0201527096 /NCGR_PEP_ID=MMETSP0161_2-20130828/33974_1 /ASSEMBLY_ACC=CAM_ASM_000251 /TAXON_ID=180227 /ORGANISM="Neoparamoeba aestuarina, Strain SoJaBio B1-5/56/2" /LENGTH=178 /DNA_ID=CAMNT_0047927759 /DNA_START=9 /DNA_END=545 /DNA_ORIENTATION=+